ncbi:MAG: CapA family protein [Lachnospiraceae bacterium]|nr:CapA family protein [Lachnospiraceae bacterium]
MKNKFVKIIGVIVFLVIFLGTIFILPDSLNKSSENNSDNNKVLENQESSSDIGDINSDNEKQDTNKSNINDEQESNVEEVIKDEENKESFVTLKMVGDVLLHTPVSDSGKMSDGSYNYDHLFKNVKEDISSADIALVNQEVILGGTEMGLSGYPAFNGAYEVGDSIVNAGFDVVLHATNHAIDRGKNGLINCLDFWESKYPDIAILGINRTKEQQDTVFIIEKNGIKIAILNYTYGTNGIAMPDDMPFAVNLIDKNKIARDIEIAEANADITIVCPHWGIEYTHTENSNQTELATYFAELGADVIIGTHPHVIQPVKWVEASNGNKALVYYSIGNFINCTSEYGNTVADRMVGAIANVTIKKASDGSVIISDYSVTPLVTQMLFGTAEITTYKLEDYNQELASKNEVITRDERFSYDFCVNLCNEVFGDVKQE